MQGAGSPQAQRIQVLRETDFEKKQSLARRLAGIIASDRDTL
jgi:4-hydroxybutyryl-CoA dehydratase/vinylacetyl-CoA-Delta-isomerase